jgi:hypothetical protein
MGDGGERRWDCSETLKEDKIERMENVDDWARRHSLRGPQRQLNP